MTGKIIIKEPINSVNTFKIIVNALQPVPQAIRTVDHLVTGVRDDIVPRDPTDIQEIRGWDDFHRHFFVIVGDPADIVRAEQFSRLRDMPGKMAELNGKARAGRQRL